MNLIFLFLYTFFIALSIGLCQSCSSQLNTCFIWFFSRSVPMEYKDFLYICFLFWFFSELPFLLLPIPVFCPVPEFLYNLSSRISSTHKRSISAIAFLSVASPFSPQHSHSTFSPSFFAKLSFSLDFLFRSCSLSLLFSQVLSQASCGSGWQIWAALSFSISSTAPWYKEIDHRSPVS